MCANNYVSILIFWNSFESTDFKSIFFLFVVLMLLSFVVVIVLSSIVVLTQNGLVLSCSTIAFSKAICNLSS
jgi:uncharacterized membrane protein YobD (UPF0266 family)